MIERIATAFQCTAVWNFSNKQEARDTGSAGKDKEKVVNNRVLVCRPDRFERGLAME